MALSLDYTGLELAHLPVPPTKGRLYVTDQGTGKLKYWRTVDIVRKAWGKWYWKADSHNLIHVHYLGKGKYLI